MPATRIWSAARVKNVANVEANGTWPRVRETDGDRNEVLFRDETFGGAFGKFFEEFFRVGGIFRVAVQRD